MVVIRAAQNAQHARFYAKLMSKGRFYALSTSQ